MVNFSERSSGAAATPNTVALAEQRARSGGVELLNLSDSNPTRLGLAPAVLPQVYRADPRGPLSAREMLAHYISTERRHAVPAAQLYLLSSTSQAYAWLMQLLCDPGDIVLAPAPGYPLVEQIARLSGVQVRYYRLGLHEGWAIDTAHLEQLLAEHASDGGSSEAVCQRGDVAPKIAGTQGVPAVLTAHQRGRVRAVVVINPGNPTGTYTHHFERERLVELCARYGVALISDEVFFNYPLMSARSTAPSAAAGAASPVRLSGDARVLTFGIDGLSKNLAAPGAKVAWIQVSGPLPDVREAQMRLDGIADTFLPMSDIICAQLPQLLNEIPAQQEVVRCRCLTNLAALRELVSREPSGVASVLEPEGGWSALLRFPATIAEDELITALIQRGITAQPGYFFDMPIPGFVSISLLLEPDRFRMGVELLLAEIARRA